MLKDKAFYGRLFEDVEAVVNDEIRSFVKGFYEEAALDPKKALCCPIRYDETQVSHIPPEVLDIAYGCGSPVGLGRIMEGEVAIDLGCGGGIDSFIAAKKVGRSGRVIGIDMTEEMLSKAENAYEKVAKNLGFKNVEFKKGFLEKIPLSSETADVLLSNCVVNLSGDKEMVFKEIYRVLKHKGRFCISDIVAEKELPQRIRLDKTLWGECIAGALKQDEFIGIAKGEGFYGIEMPSRSFYREVEGIRFYSITLRGYKFVKGNDCTYKGHYAIYNGPFKSASDDDGHEFHVGIPEEVCSDTLEKLKNPPYKGMFSIIDAGNNVEKETCDIKACC